MAGRIVSGARFVALLAALCLGGGGGWAFSPGDLLNKSAFGSRPAQQDSFVSPPSGGSLPETAPAKQGTANAGAFAIRAESRVEPEKKEQPVNRTFEYIVTARWKGDLGAVSVRTPDTPDLENLECLSASVSNRTHPENGEASAEFRFLLKPKAQGSARIGRARIEYSAGANASPAQIIVEGAAREIGKAARDWGRIAYGTAAIAGAMVMLVALLVWLVRRFARKEPSLPARLSPFEALRQRLEGLERPLMEGDYSAYYGEMRNILWAALAQAGFFAKRPPTPGEFAAWIESRGDGSERQEMRRWLELLEKAERARFAGWTPGADDNRAARRDLESALRGLEQISASGEAAAEGGCATSTDTERK